MKEKHFIKFKKLFFLLAIILLTTANTLNIIPDPQNPIQIRDPNIKKDLTIDIRFKFSQGSSGLIYSNYIAVEFSEKMLFDLNYQANATPKFKCELTDSASNQYKMEPESPSNEEPYIAFCKMSDNAFAQLNDPELTYKLTLTFDPVVKILANLSKSVKLFTCSSTKPSRIIIDQANFVGNLAIYNDPLSMQDKLIDITSSDIKVGSNLILNLFPFQIFDVVLEIKSNSFISTNDFLIVFKFDKNYIAPPQTAITESALGEGAQNDGISGPLKGNLVVNPAFGDGMISITGIEEDLIPNRKFKMILRNFRVLEKTINVLSPLEMIVYYRNTYSVYSHVIVSQNFFKISAAKINITAGHPDGWDIFRNGIFPMHFSFTAERDLYNGGFVLIQHVNAENLKNKFNFVASTCDFSANDKTSFSQSFGRRPICFPIRTDFNYPNSDNAVFKGSGVFFYINQIIANKTYHLTVWGSADACGGSNLTDFGSAIAANTNTNAQFKFQLTVFNGINASEINENRFSDANIIGQSAEQTMENKCWNTQSQIISDIPLNDETKKAYALNPFSESLLAEITKVTTATGDCNSSRICNLERDVNLYREFNNISLVNLVTPYTEKSYFDDMTAADKFSEFYLYGANTLTTNSYFAVKITYPTHAGKKFIEGFPVPVTTKVNDRLLLPGRLILNLQRRWFLQGDAPDIKNGCYFSWGTDALDTESNALGGNAINVCSTVLSEKNNRFMLSKQNASCFDSGSSQIPAEIDVKNSFIPRSGMFNTLPYYRLISEFHKGELGHENTKKSFFAFPLPKAKLIKATAATSTSISIGLFTTCFKWNTNFQNIKSLYTSIDIQLNWLYTTDSASLSGPPVRAIRLIKLFPEGGVFQDLSVSGKKFAEANNLPDISAVNGAQKPYKLHFGLGSEYGKNGVCLIEIFAVGLANATGDSMSPVMAIWIGFGVLLEQDYSDLNANYPIAPLASPNYLAYGLQSGYVMNSTENFNVHNSFNSASFKKYIDSSIASNINKLPLRLLLHNYSLTTDEYRDDVAKYSSVANYSNASTSFNNRSHYFFLMGSLILVNGIAGNSITSVNATTNAQNNLLIPIYCPLHDTVKKTVNFLNGIPTLYIAFLNMPAFNNVVSVNKIFSQKFQATPGNQFVIFTPNSEVNIYYRRMDKFVTTKAFSGLADSTNYLFTLRWAPYSSTLASTDNIIYLYYGHIAGGFSAQPNLNCTGHVFLINQNLISIESAGINKIGINGGEISLYNGSKKFYYLGFEFHKAILIGLGQGFDVPADTNSVGSFSPQSLSQESSIYGILGIKRPTIDAIFNSEKFNSPFNSIAYFCSSSHYSSTQMYSNFLYISDTQKYFIVDFNSPSNSLSNFQIQIGPDKNEPVYKNDKAGSAKLQLTLPSRVPGGTKLVFSMPSDIMNSSTICGLTSNPASNAVTECENVSGTSISCTLPRNDNNFEICCYNIVMFKETVKLESLYLSFPPAFTGENRFNIDKIYDAQSQVSMPYFSWFTNQAGGVDILNSQFAKITGIEYVHVNQESGIGKVYLYISLPRDPVRNSSITVTGDFTAMLIPNTKPSCKATFANGFNSYYDGSPDVFIDSCNVNLTSTQSPITIRLKNFVYKCGMNFINKNLLIAIYPVAQINYAIAPFSSNQYKVLMGLNNIANDQIAFFAGNFNLSLNTEMKQKPSDIGKWDTLCKLTSVAPNIPGEYADYSFEFDLDSYKDALSSANPNEFSIFFPEALYGSQISDVVCYMDNLIVNCNFPEDGILNIRFLTTLTIKKTTVTVAGIHNPYYEKSINFPCTINSTNFATGERTNLVTGSGKLESGFTLNNIPQGVLRFVNIYPNNSDLNPRSTSNHTFKVTFDAANGITQVPINLSSNPQIIITFPNDYNLAFSNTSAISASIEEFVNDSLNKISRSNNNPSVSSVKVSGNKVTIDTVNTNYSFQNNFRYWEIKLFNVPGPDESTETDPFLPYSATGMFSIILTTVNYNAVYRTFTNLNNHSAKKLPSTPFDSFIAFNRGINFAYDNSKWVIDINNNNILVLRPGRFFKSFFTVRPDTKNFLKSSSALLSIQDKNFKLSDENYNVITLLNEHLSFYIGAPCGTAPGRYLLLFNLNPNPAGSSFAPLAPLMVNLDSSVQGSISFNDPALVPFGGSVPLFISLSEPNVDTLSVSWVPGETARNDPSSRLTDLRIEAAKIKAGEIYNSNGENIMYCIFSITNTEVILSQIFRAKPVNNCYTWKTNLVTFSFSGSLAQIPKQIDASVYFRYTNPDSDSTIHEKNAIKINFIPPYAPVYLHCALLCNNLPYPEDAEVLKANLAQNANSMVLKYYFGFFNTKTPTDILFNKLVRGKMYKLKCIISNTDGDALKRESISISMDSLNNLNSTNTKLTTAAPIKTQCLHYNFNGDPGVPARAAILNYCQKLFSNTGWTANGCFYCMDSSFTQYASSMNFATNSIPAFSCSYGKKRILQNIWNNYSSVSDVDFNENLDLISKESNDEDYKKLKNLRYLENIDNLGLIENYNAFNGISRLNMNKNFGDSNNFRFLQQQPATSNITNSIYYFSVCPVQNLACPYNNVFNKTYTDFFNKLSTDTKTTVVMNDNLRLGGMSINGTFIVTDTVAPAISKNLGAKIIVKELSGLVIITVTHPSSIRCFWKISLVNDAPTQREQIINCLDSSWCGANVIINSVAKNITTDPTYLKPFVNNTNYSIYFVCVNDVPYSENFSAIHPVPIYSVNTNSTNITDNNSTDSTNTNTTGNSAYQLSFNIFYFALFMLFGLINFEFY